MTDVNADVVVIGAGVAGLCAALAAKEAGANPVVIEAAPEHERAGNTAFAAGAFRIAHRGTDDIVKLIPDLSPEELATTDFGHYTDAYFSDMARLTRGRCDPDLTKTLVDASLDTAVWMRGHGVRFIPNYRSQGYVDGGKTRFRGTTVVTISGGGAGLTDALYRAIDRAGIPVFYNTRAIALERTMNAIEGVHVSAPGSANTLRTNSVVIASGGFESNPAWRARYLGPGWDLAKVRGTRHNTGDGLRIATDIGASTAGHWSGCHSVAWDLNAPTFGDISVGVDFKKDSYQYCVMINAHGQRFLDEGEDIRTFTYAKNGAIILRQPAQFAWQIFDGKVLDLLRDEYKIRRVTKVRADSLEALANQLSGVDKARFLRTIQTFNDAVITDVPFNPNVKDGRATRGLPIPKSNWANTIDTPPFEAYAVTCGVTFTFGGLRISTESEVIDVAGLPIPGLYACGSATGGLFYFNYPGGSGLIAGAVYGKIAGTNAAKHCVGR